MKKSKAVPAVLVAGMAAAILAGCGGPTEVRRCADQTGNLLPDQQCTSPGGYYASGVYPRWVYGGDVQNNQVRNFRSTPSSGATVVDSKGGVVSRGGIGRSSGSSFGG